MGWTGNGADDGLWMLTGLFWIATVASLIWMMLRFLPWKRRVAKDATVAGPRSSEEILDQQFASGELDADSYRLQRSVLAQERRR